MENKYNEKEIDDLDFPVAIIPAILGSKRLKEKNIAVLLISHRMPDIFEVCDKLVVLRRGERVCNKNINDSSTEEATGLITGAIERI